MSKCYVSQEDIDDIANNLSSCIISSAEKSFCKINKSIKTFEEIPKWFGPKCSNTRKKFHRAKYNYKLRKTNYNKDKLKEASREYKITVKRFYNKFKKDNINKIRNLRTTNPKKYWKILNGKKQETTEATMNNLFEFFSKNNSSENNGDIDPSTTDKDDQNTDETFPYNEKVQVGKDQEKAQSEKDSHSKNRGGKKPT